MLRGAAWQGVARAEGRMARASPPGRAAQGALSKSARGHCGGSDPAPRTPCPETAALCRGGTFVGAHGVCGGAVPPPASAVPQCVPGVPCAGCSKPPRRLQPPAWLASACWARSSHSKSWRDSLVGV
eukprot:scaffold52580_cov45-Phaeocystis_antarctica.AAC.2